MAIVYRHRRLDTNEIFYVGIGKNENRAYVKKGRNSIWNKIVSKTEYNVEIVSTHLTIEEVKELEVFLISLYGRLNLKTGVLANMTDGGDGCENLIHTEETKEKLSEINTGKKLTEETKEKIRLTHIGNTYWLGKILSEEHKENIKKANLGKTGKKHTEEAKKKISEAKKGTRHSETTKEKMRGNRDGRIIINEQTGIFYMSIKEASKTINMRTGTLVSQLCGQNKNKTYFKYV